MILALAAYALGDYEQCLSTLPDENGGFTAKKEASSHDLDLQVLAITLRGTCHGPRKDANLSDKCVLVQQAWPTSSSLKYWRSPM